MFRKQLSIRKDRLNLEDRSIKYLLPFLKPEQLRDDGQEFIVIKLKLEDHLPLYWNNLDMEEDHALQPGKKQQAAAHTPVLQYCSAVESITPHPGE